MTTDDVQIRPEYSAVAAKHLSTPTRAAKAAITALRDRNVASVCEVGCGLLANSHHFLNEFERVVLVDTVRQRNRISTALAELSANYESYAGFVVVDDFAKSTLAVDAGVLINVLHILPSRDERVDVLKGTAQNVNDGGIVFVDVPCNESYYRGIEKRALQYGDGYIMRRNSYYTFYKNMTIDEVQDLLCAAGLKVLDRIVLSHRISFLAGHEHEGPGEGRD